MTTHRRRSLSFLLAGVLSLAACQPASPSATAGPASHAPTATAAASNPKPTAAAPATPAATVAAPTGMPPQSNAAGIRPPEKRAELTRLSNLLTFQVRGHNNANLGKISDYVINTCETYIVYFVVAPAAELKLPAGQKLVIPFEAVTINSGILDADAKTIGLDLAPASLTGAPTFPDALALLPNNWEQPVRDYWQRVVRVGKLSSACNTSGGQLHKIAYATQLLGAQLKDGNQKLLGVVQEGILEPETGKLGYRGQFAGQIRPDLAAAGQNQHPGQRARAGRQDRAGAAGGRQPAGRRPAHCRGPGQRCGRAERGPRLLGSIGVALTNQTPPAEWTFRQVAGATFTLALVAMAFWLLYLFNNVVFILFVAIVIGTVIRPVVVWLYWRGVPRIAGVILVYLLLLALVIGFLLLLFPLISEQSVAIAAALPGNCHSLRELDDHQCQSIGCQPGPFLAAHLWPGCRRCRSAGRGCSIRPGRR